VADFIMHAAGRRAVQSHRDAVWKALHRCLSIQPDLEQLHSYRGMQQGLPRFLKVEYISNP
jgi:hypothetical protein